MAKNDPIYRVNMEDTIQYPKKYLQKQCLKTKLFFSVSLQNTWLSHSYPETSKMVIDKQCRSRSDAT